jgi:hypothetical protein
VAEILVTRTGDDRDGGRLLTRYRVEVHGDGSRTEHDVSLHGGDFERLAGERTPEAFVRDCFAFLLEREPKESILRSFDVSVIGRYFPEFEREIASS